jgi:DNA repair protein RecN (Recombination protein N)
MLRLLKIRDFALVRNLEIEFKPGLNLLTGETGSGKSIVVDALGLLAGDRPSPELIRRGAETATMEGEFEIAASEAGIAAILEEAGIQCGDATILVRREINSAGRSRNFVNNSLATLGLLRSLGEALVEIHGQHDRQSLLDLPTHLEWVDRFGGNAAEAAAIRERFRRLRDILRRLDAMKMDEQERLRRVDVLQFQLEEIRRVAPKPGEKESLETERRLLANREKIYSLANETYALVYEDESSILTQANRLLRLLQELESYDPRWLTHREALRESIYRLEDLSYSVRDYSANLEFSPARLDEIERRLSDIDRLCRKYGNSVDEVLHYESATELQLQSLLSHAESTRELEELFSRELREYAAAVEPLSRKRHADAGRLERELRKEFRNLAMDRMDLRVHFHPCDETAADGRLPGGNYGPTGIDRVEFLVSPNKGEEFKPLAKIASGGELSRIMLSIRTVCGSADSGKALVFDEVDAGIGGRAAEAVGRRLAEISRTNQVLCVTHLPQIAAFADQHFRVQKDAVGSRTETSVHELDDAQRMEELARMLGGEVITETTRRHAREMRQHSRDAAPRAREALRS